MRFLLDTHVWIWTQESPERLGPQTRATLEDEDNGVFISPVSTLEIAQLTWSERITLAGRPQTWVAEAMAALLAETAPLTHEIALAAYELPGTLHRDPADRILVATARVHDFTLLTADERILSYSHVLTANASL